MVIIERPEFPGKMLKAGVIEKSSLLYLSLLMTPGFWAFLPLFFGSIGTCSSVVTFCF